MLVTKTREYKLAFELNAIHQRDWLEMITKSTNCRRSFPLQKRRPTWKQLFLHLLMSTSSDDFFQQNCTNILTPNSAGSLLQTKYCCKIGGSVVQTYKSFGLESAMPTKWQAGSHVVSSLTLVSSQQTSTFTLHLTKYRTFIPEDLNHILKVMVYVSYGFCSSWCNRSHFW